MLPSGKNQIACKNCRRRGRKCDKQIPTCHACRARGDECEGYRMRWPGVAARGHLAYRSVPLPSEVQNGFIASSTSLQTPLKLEWRDVEGIPEMSARLRESVRTSSRDASPKSRKRDGRGWQRSQGRVDELEFSPSFSGSFDPQTLDPTDLEEANVEVGVVPSTPPSLFRSISMSGPRIEVPSMSGSGRTTVDTDRLLRYCSSIVSFQVKSSSADKPTDAREVVPRFGTRQTLTNNPYTTCVLPLVQEATPLLYSILSIAYCHQFVRGGDRANLVRCLYLRGESLKGLQERLNTVETAISAGSLETLLILTHLEVLFCHSGVPEMTD